MIKLRHALLIGCTFLLSSCHYAILDPKGIIAATEKKILLEAIFLMLIVVVPVIFLSVIIPWRYRASNTKATYTPNWSHNTLMEIIWWAIPCVIIAILSVMAWIDTHSLDPYRPLAADEDTVMVEAIALNWKWLFIYPEQRIATVNDMVIPVNKPVRLFITSANAPMNSLEIPQLAGQIYAMTGMQTKLNLLATSEGNYIGLSTNFSGDGFSGMNFLVKVTSEEKFNTFLHTAENAPTQLNMQAFHTLAKPSENNPITYYSHVRPGLFTQLVVKYMGNMPGMVLGYASTAQGRSQNKDGQQS